MCLVSEVSHCLGLTQFKVCGSRLQNPLLVFLFQFQEMLKQYEENLHNERIEKTRLSEDYRRNIQVLTSVRNQINFQPTIFSRAFLTQVSVMNLTTASLSSENFTLSLNAVANAPCLVISRFIFMECNKEY